MRQKSRITISIGGHTGSLERLSLAAIHGAQVRSYLKAAGRLLGLLINFNVRLLRDGLRRIVLTPGGAVTRAGLNAMTPWPDEAEEPDSEGNRSDHS